MFGAFIAALFVKQSEAYPQEGSVVLLYVRCCGAFVVLRWLCLQFCALQIVYPVCLARQQVTMAVSPSRYLLWLQGSAALISLHPLVATLCSPFGRCIRVALLMSSPLAGYSPSVLILRCRRDLPFGGVFTRDLQVVIIAAPANAHPDLLRAIAPFIDEGAAVGALFAQVKGLKMRERRTEGREVRKGTGLARGGRSEGRR